MTARLRALCNGVRLNERERDDLRFLLDAIAHLTEPATPATAVAAPSDRQPASRATPLVMPRANALRGKEG